MRAAPIEAGHGRRRPAAAGLLSRRAAARGASTQGIAVALRAHADQPEVPVPGRTRSGHRSRRGASSASATSSWRAACPSSSGAAFPTTSCSTLAAQGRLSAPARARAAGAAHARRSAVAGAHRQLRGPVAASCATCPGRFRTRTSSPTSTTTSVRHSGARSELFFDSIVRENQSVVDLLTANYTFVNERLAQALRHPERVRQPVPPRDGDRSEPRMGLLGQGEVLMMTSHADRTSPVRRGKWILENILGTPPPPPPDNVPPLKDKNTLEKPLTMRAQMEEHRANPACASCHKLMDPRRLLARELRRGGQVARHRRRAAPIDPTGQLADGTKVDGPVGLRQALLRRPEVFVETFTEKLLTYALGRGVDVLRHADGPGDRARRRARQLPLLVDSDRDRQEHAVSDADEARARGRGGGGSRRARSAD